MYAVIKAGGKQHKVQPGDVIEVELMHSSGDTVTFTPLLVVDDDGGAHVGKEASKAKVTAKLVGDQKGDKVKIFKYRPKTGYAKRAGHRQMYTLIEIQDVSLGGTTSKKAVTSQKPAASEKSEKAPKAEKAEKPEKAETAPKAEKAEKPPKAEKAPNAGDAEKTEPEASAETEAPPEPGPAVDPEEAAEDAAAETDPEEADAGTPEPDPEA